VLLAATAFIVAFALALYVTPVMRRAALQFGILDRPNAPLKQHAAPVAYLGGLAVFVGFLITLALTFEFSATVLGILLAGTIMVLAGLIDDLGALSPAEKLVCECLAVGVLLKSGLFVKLTFLPPGMDFVLSVLWMLTVINAINIIDIMDGLAPGVAAIAALFLAAIALATARPMIAVMAAALAGSLLGFLRYNSEPASIYLGDSGSLFIGLILAALSMNGSYTRNNWAAMLAPVVVLGVPLFDLALVSVIRWRKGLSPFRGSPDHFAIRLRRAGLSVRQVVGLTYVSGLLLGAVALLVMRTESSLRAGAILAALGCTALAVGVLLSRTGEEWPKRS
jgi:UDP-GlcNAc:undecaprenyl-phosphate GlcNAc-1-phosphate transferase